MAAISHPGTHGPDSYQQRGRSTSGRAICRVDSEHRLVALVSLDDVLALLGQEMANVAATISGELAVERRITAT